MKTMKDFAAQQLSKKQMNEVKGGATYVCATANGEVGIYKFDSALTMLAFLDMNGGGRCDAID